MPKKLQIHTFKRIFKAYNKNSDPYLIDWSGVIDGTLELPENRDVLRETYPRFCWSKYDVKKEEGVVVDGGKRKYYLEESDHFVKYATVRPHRIKSKGKTYEKGRIQLSINPMFIGCKARVEVKIYVTEKEDELVPEEPKKSEPTSEEREPLKNAELLKIFEEFEEDT